MTYVVGCGLLLVEEIKPLGHRSGLDSSGDAELARMLETCAPAVLRLMNRVSEARAIHEAAQIELPQLNGDDSWRLPAPATFVIDRDGVVGFAHVDGDVRLGVVEGEFHWHKHDAEDEFFLVLEGEFVIEVEGAPTARLRPGQGYTVPHGVRHKPSAPVRTVIVMVEPAGVIPTGD